MMPSWVHTGKHQRRAAAGHKAQRGPDPVPSSARGMSDVEDPKPQPRSRPDTVMVSSPQRQKQAWSQPTSGSPREGEVTSRGSDAKPRRKPRAGALDHSLVSQPLHPPTRPHVGSPSPHVSHWSPRPQASLSHFPFTVLCLLLHSRAKRQARDPETQYRPLPPARPSLLGEECPDHQQGKPKPAPCHQASFSGSQGPCQHRFQGLAIQTIRLAQAQPGLTWQRPVLPQVPGVHWRRTCRQNPRELEAGGPHPGARTKPVQKL